MIAETLQPAEASSPAEERDVVASAAAYLGRLVRLEADRGLDGAHESSRAW